MYAYQESKKVFVYYEIPSLELNNGNTTDFNKLETTKLAKKIVNAIGGIVEVEKEGTTFYFSKQPLVKSIWKNGTDRDQWRMLQIQNDDYDKLLRSKHDSDLIEALQPLKELYIKSHYKTRRFIIAEVIRVITGG